MEGDTHMVTHSLTHCYHYWISLRLAVDVVCMFQTFALCCPSAVSESPSTHVPSQINFH